MSEVSQQAGSLRLRVRYSDTQRLPLFGLVDRLGGIESLIREGIAIDSNRADPKTTQGTETDIAEISYHSPLEVVFMVGTSVTVSVLAFNRVIAARANAFNKFEEAREQHASIKCNHSVL